MRIGFIGTGKMATALATGLVRQGVVTAADITAASPPDDGTYQLFLDNFPADTAQWTDDNAECVRTCDVIVLAVKPQVMDAVIAPLQDVSAGKLFISVAAGISLAFLEERLHPEARVIRCMPNTPVLVGAGASVFAPGLKASSADAETARQILSAGGIARQVDESAINAVTALSGSGPAYVFYFIEALIAGGIREGLDADLARDLAIQTVLGSAKLVEQSGTPPLELAEAVKSPKGTTVAACEVLEARDWMGIVGEAVAAARRRADELGASN